VAASIFPVYDVVRRVAGDRVVVELVLPPGQTDHGFEPRPRDPVRLAGVELGFVVGLGLDPWAGRTLAAATDDRVVMVELGPRLDPRPRCGEEALDRDDHAHGPLEPHVFLDPERMARAAGFVAIALAERDPAGREGYEARASIVAASLRALDQELRERSSRWRGDAIVTFHGSFDYFAERYGLTVAAVVEPVPGREPTPRGMARLLAIARDRSVVALFSEPQLDPRPARLLAAEAGLPLYELDSLGGGPGAQSLEELLRKNASVLDEALR
jgi:ABC-type Zn uptake system ZnuABC Zn-binding protein ZnuA